MICDQCGHDPCMTLTFCGVLRAHEENLQRQKGGNGSGFVPTPAIPSLPASTKAAADYVVKFGDAARLRRFLSGRSDAEKTQILKYLEGDLR